MSSMYFIGQGTDNNRGKGYFYSLSNNKDPKNPVRENTVIRRLLTGLSGNHTISIRNSDKKCLLRFVVGNTTTCKFY